MVSDTIRKSVILFIEHIICEVNFYREVPVTHLLQKYITVGKNPQWNELEISGEERIEIPGLWLINKLSRKAWRMKQVGATMRKCHVEVSSMTRALLLCFVKSRLDAVYLWSLCPPPPTFLYAAQAKDPGVIFDASLSSQFTSSPLTLVLSAVSSHTSRVRPSLNSAFAFCLLNLISQETL